MNRKELESYLGKSVDIQFYGDIKHYKGVLKLSNYSIHQDLKYKKYMLVGYQRMIFRVSHVKSLKVIKEN